MRNQRSTFVAVLFVALAGCGSDTAYLVEPDRVDVWLGPEVIATTADLQSLGALAADPMLVEISEQLPEDHPTRVLSALHHFETGLQSAPGPSFAELESSLVVVDDDPKMLADPDADVANGALELYRDWASQTLFGIERDALGDLPKPTGN